MSLKDHYKARYGDWAGNPRGYAPNYDKCCKEVFKAHRAYQCSKPNGHGPDGAYCKQHNPAVVEARRAEYERKAHTARVSRFRDGLGDALHLIEAIAAGHNEPRAACLDWLVKNKEKLTYPDEPAVAPPPPPPPPPKK